MLEQRLRFGAPPFGDERRAEDALGLGHSPVRRPVRGPADRQRFTKPYRATEQDRSLRAFLPDVMAQVERRAVHLVDVRSPQEFSGEMVAPPGLPETCQRGGHIPGASNIPWSKAVNEDDGPFKEVDELRSLYRAAGITGDRPIITYCRIGERSSHSWFVLTYLLGHRDTKNYDGSWTEWGNLVAAPVATGQ